MAPHELIVASPATAELCRFRQGRNSIYRELDFGIPKEFGDSRFTLYPSGHMLGAAMLYVEEPEGTLLYTGDCKLQPSLTAEAIEIRNANTLIMECTFGSPRFRFPSLEVTVRELLKTLERVWSEQRLPIVHAYAVGKAQEVVRLLNDQELDVYAHPRIRKFCDLYERLGCEVGPTLDLHSLPQDGQVAGRVVVQPPRKHRGSSQVEGFATRTIALTGWSVEPAYTFRNGVDYAIPLSDHAAFNDLLDLADQVNPDEIFCLHGSREFVQHLKRKGHNVQAFLSERE